MNITPKICARLSALLFVLLFSSFAYAGSAKVSICHVPPGNPDNFHTIKISANALPAHLAHGDLGEPCNEVCTILCDDGDACTVDDDGMDCEQDGCAAPLPVNCNDGNECTTDSCDSFEGCLNTPNVGDSCDTGEICSTNETCNVNGVCEGEPIDNCCIDDTECSQDRCAGAFCSDANRCESNPVDCDDSDACTVDACDSVTGDCENIAVECGSGEQCDTGTGICEPIPVACPCFDADYLVLLGDVDPNIPCGNNTPFDGIATVTNDNSTGACSGFNCGIGSTPEEPFHCGASGFGLASISEDENIACQTIIVQRCSSPSVEASASSAASMEMEAGVFEISN